MNKTKRRINHASIDKWLRVRSGSLLVTRTTLRADLVKGINLLTMKAAQERLHA